MRTAILDIEAILTDGARSYRVRLSSGAVAWVRKDRVLDGVPGGLVVPAWYRKWVLSHPTGRTSNRAERLCHEADANAYQGGARQPVDS